MKYRVRADITKLGDKPVPENRIVEMRETAAAYWLRTGALSPVRRGKPKKESPDNDGDQPDNISAD